MAKKFTLVNAPEGMKYLCIGPNCWGADKNAEKAIKNCKKNFARYVGEWRYMLYLSSEEATVDGMGYVTRKTESPDSVLVGTFNALKEA
jgi:hypothetical protein